MNVRHASKFETPRSPISICTPSIDYPDYRQSWTLTSRLKNPVKLATHASTSPAVWRHDITANHGLANNASCSENQPIR
jgi:hypothetical protein